MNNTFLNITLVLIGGFLIITMMVEVALCNDMSQLHKIVEPEKYMPNVE